MHTTILVVFSRDYIPTYGGYCHGIVAVKPQLHSQCTSSKRNGDDYDDWIMSSAHHSCWVIIHNPENIWNCGRYKDTYCTLRDQHHFEWHLGDQKFESPRSSLFSIPLIPSHTITIPHYTTIWIHLEPFGLSHYHFCLMAPVTVSRSLPNELLSDSV